MRSYRNILLFFTLFFAISACQVPKETVSESIIVGDCGKGTPYLAIHEIQGSQHRSPYDGKEVACVQGIVTAIDGGGFYLQEIYPDDDPRTSEGIYVDLKAFAKVKTGDQVVIESGTVREYNPAGVGENSLTITTLRTTKVEVVKNDQELPEPIVLGNGGLTIPDRIIENDVNGNVGRSTALFDPEEDGMDFFESLESMRVQINNAVAISSVNGYNEVFVLADMGENASGLNQEGVLLLTPDDPNPERLLLDDTFISMPKIKLGDHSTQPIIGIVGYDFANYRIMPTEKLVFEAGDILEKHLTMPEIDPTDKQISVASFNVLNLSHNEDLERLKKIAATISKTLYSPDILILQEIMDDDGRMDSQTTSADENLRALCDAIRSSGGAEYYWFNIDPIRNADGGVKGGNIRVVILYRLDRGLKFLSAPAGSAETEVGLIGEGQDLVLDQNPGLIWPNNSDFRQSRKPIIAQFQFNDQNFFVIGVHFNSKGPDGPLYGDQQPPDLASERQRIAQARAVNGFVKDILELDPNARILVAGDMNDFPWSEAITSLKGEQLNNLFDTISTDLWFTYIHEGNGQIMDQILVSDSFLKQMREFMVLNINSVLPAKEQISDHDPVLAIFDFGYYE